VAVSRLWKWLKDSVLVALRVGRVKRRARRLEKKGMLNEAFDEILFALEMLRSPWLDYWNPLAFSYRFEATVALGRIALRLGRPVPREPLEEQLEAIQMFRAFAHHDAIFDQEVTLIRRYLDGKSEPT
jgi:hypothetical protein